MKSQFFVFILCFGLSVNAQVGVGTTNPVDGSILDIESTDKGVLIPRMDITDLTTLAPVTKLPASPEPVGLLVFNTDATNGGANEGFYYWDGNDWIPIGGSIPSDDWTLLGNSGTSGGNTTTDGVNFIGTTDNQNLNFRTNNLYRGRFSNLGEFFVGTQNTVITGDLMNAVGNLNFPWAVNGYTTNNGGGVYGAVTLDGTPGTGGTTSFAGVQGEYMGTSALGPGVRGITFTTTAGSDFTGNTVSGVNGSLLTGNIQRAFGVLGDTGNNFTVRAGGVIGTDFFASGSLGYYASNFISYGVYAFSSGFGNGLGRLNESSGTNTHVGMGIHGGFLGGWVKGKAYGAIFSGESFGSYSQGKQISNDAFVVLEDLGNRNERKATYASTALSIDIQTKGIGVLSSGFSRVNFNTDFSELIDDSKPIIVTITPLGESKGVHIASIDKNGFVIKENDQGNSNVKFNWIAIAEKANTNKEISAEVLSSEFDDQLSEFMINENKTDAKAIWFENGEFKFGPKAPENSERLNNFKKRPKLSRGELGKSNPN